MSGLSPEDIKALLAKPEKKRGKKKGPDSSVRDIKTWLALAPQSRDLNREQPDLRCDNPNCLDPRPPRISPLDGSEIKHQFCVQINGQLVCRYCFLGGWLLNDPDQLSLVSNG
jgi:hypothetical protein